MAFFASRPPPHWSRNQQSSHFREERELRTEQIIVLETTVDHITGEEIGNALEQLNNMTEILDLVYIPATGKKNRPCGVMQAICRPEDEDVSVQALFRHTHALGIRRLPMERYVLPRSATSVLARGQKVKAKTHELEGRSYTRPEADELARLASAQNLGMPALRFIQED